MARYCAAPRLSSPFAMYPSRTSVRGRSTRRRSRRIGSSTSCRHVVSDDGYTTDDNNDEEEEDNGPQARPAFLPSRTHQAVFASVEDAFRREDWVDNEEGDDPEAVIEAGVSRMVRQAPPSSRDTQVPKQSVTADSVDRGGADGVSIRPLVFWENMVCGAVSRSIAQTIMHPANTMKTILQSHRGPNRPTILSLMAPSSFQRLTYGAGTNFLLSVPHGALNFATLEFVRGRMAKLVDSVPALKNRIDTIRPGLDFLSSAVSTVCCSVVSTPQMMITDNIMAGNYNNLPAAVKGLASEGGLSGFYRGWWPGVVGKIPSYVSAYL